MAFWKRKEVRPVVAEDVMRDALSRARRISDYATRLIVFSYISPSLSKAGEIERALDLVREIGELRFALNPESIDGDRASALSYVSKALAETGATERAERMIEEALSITKGINDDGIRSKTLLNISTALAKVGEIERALDIARGISHEFRPSALSAISGALTKAGEIEKAKEVVKEALDIARIISSDWYRVRALSHISVALAKAGDLDEAKKVIEQALGVAEGIHDRTKYDTSHWSAIAEVGEALAEIGQTERALDIARGISFDRYRVHSFSSISEAFAKEGKIEKAKEIIEEALSITKRTRDDFVRSIELSKIYVALRSIEQAQKATGEDK